MKLVIFGLTISSSWGNGHATIWRGLCAALARRGHRVVFFEKDAPYYAAHRDLTEFAGGRLELYRSWEEVRELAARELSDADVGMVTSYSPDGIAATDLICSLGRGLRVFYDLDTPVTLSAVREGESLSYIGPSGLGGFDLVLSYTGGSALKELHTRLGAKRVAPLYGSVDPEMHKPAPPVPNFASDLSYLGTYAMDRQDGLRKLFIEPARRLPRQRFLIGGAQYPEAFPWLENIFFVRHIAPARHPGFYCSSRLTLNVTRKAMAKMGYCPSGRLFEAAACGAALVSDWWEGLDEFFEPDSEIIVARTTEETLDALDRSEVDLVRMARRARERALEEHTADRRVLELEMAIQAAGSGPREETPPDFNRMNRVEV